MDRKKMKQLCQFFYDELTGNTLPFWIDHAVDSRYGGFVTYLDRRGEPLSTDKPMWVHGRITWLFSRLFNVLEKRQEWLDLARHGMEFLLRHGFDTDGRMFYLVTRDGQPLRKRRYLYTESFGVIGLAEYARASGDGESLDRARSLMDLLLKLHNTPGALEPKVNPRVRQSRTHAMSMVIVSTLQVLRAADPENETKYDDLISREIEGLFEYFVKPEKKALFETVGMQGELLDSPEGRCLNPGHAIETAWFILEEAKRRKDRALMEKTLPLIEWNLERGWDSRHGGIFYFLDSEGKQPEPLEWDMKLWWVHNEAIYATLLAYSLTGQHSYLEWFDRVFEWSEEHFPDREHGEWFGYLHYDGSVALDFKGNLWKGPYHLPRQQLNCHLLLKSMLDA